MLTTFSGTVSGQVRQVLLYNKMNYFKFCIHNALFQKYTVMNMVKPQFSGSVGPPRMVHKVWGSVKSGKHSVQKVH